MSILIAGKEPNAVKVGSQDVKAVYAGATLVWPSDLSQEVIDDWNAYARANAVGSNPYTGDTLVTDAPSTGNFYDITALRESGSMVGSPRNGSSGNTNVRPDSAYNRIIQHMVRSHDEFKFLVERNVSVLAGYVRRTGQTDMFGEDINGYQSTSFTGFGTAFNTWTVKWLDEDGIARQRDPQGAVTEVNWATATKSERRLFTGAKRRPSTKAATQESSDE